jgi:hypothetical protein
MGKLMAFQIQMEYLLAIAPCINQVSAGVANFTIFMSL